MIGGAGSADFCADRLHVVLVTPEIHYNAGNAARTTAAVGAHLHLVGPLGFSLEDRYLRRAGLDYWPHVRLAVYPDWESFAARLPVGRRVHLFVSHGGLPYADAVYRPGDFLLFGPESRGLPTDILALWPRQQVTIPQRPVVRSLNLSNAVALGLYEAWRQQGYAAGGEGL